MLTARWLPPGPSMRRSSTSTLSAAPDATASSSSDVRFAPLPLVLQLPSLEPRADHQHLLGTIFDKDGKVSRQQFKKSDLCSAHGLDVRPSPRNALRSLR